MVTMNTRGQNTCQALIHTVNTWYTIMVLVRRRRKKESIQRNERAVSSFTDKKDYVLRVLYLYGHVRTQYRIVS